MPSPRHTDTAIRARRFTRLAITALAGFVLAACAANPPTVDSQKFDYDALIKGSQAAFGNRDADTAIEAFAEDGAFYRVTDAGAVELVRGKDNLRRAMRMVFGAGNGYLDSKVVRLGLIQNVLIMYHEDRYQTDAGIKTVPKVVVVEHRDGKRWREWEFSPQDR